MNLCYRLKTTNRCLGNVCPQILFKRQRTHTHTHKRISLPLSPTPNKLNSDVSAEASLSKQNPIEVCDVCVLGAGHNLNGFWCLLWCICVNVFTSMQRVFVLAHVLMRTQCVCLCVHDRAVWDFGLNGAMNGGLCWKKKSEKKKEARQRVRATDNIATSPFPVFNWSTKQTIAQRETEREISLSDVPSRFL